MRTVLVRNQTEPVLVEEGSMVRMSCRTEKEWFFCLWQSPGEDKQCAVQDKVMHTVCAGSNRIRLSGRGNTCQVQFKVSVMIAYQV